MYYVQFWEGGDGIELWSLNGGVGFKVLGKGSLIIQLWSSSIETRDVARCKQLPKDPTWFKAGTEVRLVNLYNLGHIVSAKGRNVVFHRDLKVGEATI